MSSEANEPGADARLVHPHGRVEETLLSELAFNYQGQRFVPPGEAVHWRVRRIRDGQRGQLDVVRDAEGLPLVVPLDIGIDDFRSAVSDVTGRYRLDALTEDKLAMRDVPAAYVNVPAQRRPVGAEARAVERELVATDAVVAPATTVTAPFGTWPALPMPMAMSGTEYLLAEALRGQVQMFQMLSTALTDRVASNAAGATQMMGAAAELVRAADGAAMPRRRPVEVPGLLVPAAADLGARNAAPIDEIDLDDLDEEAPEEEKDEVDVIIDKLGKVMSAIGPSVPHIVSLVRGYPPSAGAPHRNAAPAEGEAELEESEEDEAPAVTPTMVSHMILIAQALGEDGPLLRAVLQKMARDDRRALVDHLCSLSVEDATDAAAAQLAPVKARMARRATRTSRDVATDDSADQHADAVDDSSDDAAACESSGDDEDGPSTAAAVDGPEAATTAPSKEALETHMLQIARHLTLPEVLQARSLIGSVSAAERAAWSQKLIALDPVDAAVVVRAELARRAGA